VVAEVLGSAVVWKCVCLFILCVHSTTKWMGFYVGPLFIMWMVSLFWHVVADVHLFPLIQTKCWWFVFFKCLL